MRSQQLDAFAEYSKASFRTRVVAYLKRNLPEHAAAIPERELNELIGDWQSRAARYGVVGERAVAKWCFLAMTAGDRFDEQPVIQGYLTEPSPEPSMKIDNLMDALYIRLRQAEAGAK